jgi:glycerol-3-phosphate acyltransferase PlsY
VISFALAAVAGYLLGSLPSGWFVARLHGVDIFAVGSKSSGATNVRRVLGARAGNIVFALDALKGAAAAGWPDWVRPHSPHLLYYCMVSLGAALLGHSFSCFTRFRGGKGVATGTGGLLVLLTGSTLVAAVVWVAAFYATGYVSLASILAAVTLPLAAIFIFGGPKSLLLAAALISAFVIIRHRANISRLLAGTEHKFQKKKEGDA